MTEPVWIVERDALVIHDRLLAMHAGLTGLRDEALLQSTLARPQQHFAYDKATDTIAMGALYTVGIVRNQPFMDGNKRTGFVCGVLFLELNGYKFNATEEYAVRAVLGVAAGEMDEIAFTEWMRSVSSPASSKRRRAPKKQPLH